MSLPYPGQFSFTGVNYYGIDGTDGSYANEVVATITRTGDTLLSGPKDVVTIPVTLSSNPGTASNGSDYQGLPINVTFPAGVNTEDVTIPIYQNPNVAPTKTINLKLGTPRSSGFIQPVLGSQTTATYGIVNTAFAYTNNNQPITIPSNGSANPYPDNISVSGASGTITNILVTLIGVTQYWTNDLAMLLVGPNGKAVELLSGIGGSTNANGNVITFSETAPSSLAPTIQLQSGNYLPSVNQNAALYYPFNSPAPGPNPNTGIYSTNLGDFNGISPNGQWSLYVMNENNSQGGNIAQGYQLQFQTQASTPTVTPAVTPPSTPAVTPAVTSAVTSASTPAPATTDSLINNTLPTLSVSSGVHNGNKENFTVSLSANASQSYSSYSQAFSVKYYTTDGNSQAGVNYQSVGGDLQFSAGQTTQTVSVPILTNGSGNTFNLNAYELYHSQVLNLVTGQGIT